MALFKKKQVYEEQEVELNVSVARARKKKWFWIFFWVSFVIILFLTCVLSSYCNMVNERGIITHFIPAVKDLFTYGGIFSEFRLFGPHTGYTFAWIFVFYFLLMGALYLDDVRHAHDLSGIESGSAKFNNNIKGFTAKFAEPDFSKNVILSRNVWMTMNTRKSMRNLNNLVIGGAGTGKSRFVVKPNILQANCNLVVTDPSGELIESTGTFLEKEKNYQIKVFNLVEMDKSYCYNPFHYIRDEAGVLMMIDCLIKNTTPPDQKGEKFWEDAEKSLLLALCFFLWQHMPVEDQNFNTVMKLLRMSEVDENDPDAESPLDMIFLKPRPRRTKKGKKPTMRINGKVVDDGNTDSPEERVVDDNIKKYLERVKSKEGQPQQNRLWKSLEELFPDGTDIAVNQYKTFKKGAGKTAKSILISCMVRLASFNIPQVQRLTDKDTIDLGSLSGIGENAKKQALFVIIPAADSTYNFLVSMMYSQLFETLYHIAETKCEGKTLPTNVRFLLDEFSNIGTIPEYPKKLATMRKYKISCTIILQNLAQIKSLYEDDWETLVGNCDTLTYLGSNEYTTLEYISNLLGEQTITSKDRSMSPGRKGGDSQSYKSSSRKLMTPDELRNIPNRNCVIIVRGHDPFYDLKYDYLQHPNYNETGDAHREKCYTLHTMTEDIDEAKINVLAQQQRSRDAQSLTKKAPEEIIELNPDWIDYPDIYVKMKGILFIDEDKEDEVYEQEQVTSFTPAQNIYNDEPEYPEYKEETEEEYSDTSERKVENSFEANNNSDDDVPSFNELFGEDIPETTIIEGYVVNTRTGETISGPDDEKETEQKEKQSMANNKPLMVAEQPDGYFGDEVDEANF